MSFLEFFLFIVLLSPFIIIFNIFDRIKRKRADRKRSALDEMHRKDAEIERCELRDADIQDYPYDYEVGRHANETLAIRYGIANTYGESSKSRERRRIRLRKTRKIKDSMYEVELCDFRNRRAIAVIENGEEYVKTFYPVDEDWFERFSRLEETLKGNSTMSLHQMAALHCQLTLNRYSQSRLE